MVINLATRKPANLFGVEGVLTGLRVANRKTKIAAPHRAIGSKNITDQEKIEATYSTIKLCHMCANRLRRLFKSKLVTTCTNRANLACGRVPPKVLENKSVIRYAMQVDNSARRSS